MRVNLWEHNWLTQTSCPSGRIPWDRLIADLQGGDEMDPDEVRAIVEQELNKRLPLAVQFGGDPNVYWVNGLTRIDSPDYLEGVTVLQLPADHPARRLPTSFPDGAPR